MRTKLGVRDLTIPLQDLQQRAIDIVQHSLSTGPVWPNNSGKTRTVIE
jgi:hypothetical protein